MLAIRGVDIRFAMPLRRLMLRLLLFRYVAADYAAFDEGTCVIAAMMLRCRLPLYAYARHELIFILCTILRRRRHAYAIR